MTKQQREEIIAGLINIGCTRRSDNDDYNWEYKGYTFRIYESYDLGKIFTTLMKAQETVKIWEIKSVLQIQDGR